MLDSCEMCPRKCRINRNKGETGICRTARQASVSSFNAHFAEESPLVGRKGSGTIFFTYCSLMCCFCQNFDISRDGVGGQVTDEELAAIMLSLQDAGCHNINLVTPSHVVAQALSALEKAVPAGLSLPIVYNSSGYDRKETLELLEGIVDIFMPDFKFWDPEVARAACDAPDYPDRARTALVEMHRQVGDLTLNDAGIAQKGLLVRHLVLPENMAGTRDVMRFIHHRISPSTYVNVMRQYRPCGDYLQVPALARAITGAEYERALQAAREEGITRFDKR